jgi:hypothetical protein
MVSVSGAVLSGAVDSGASVPAATAFSVVSCADGAEPAAWAAVFAAIPVMPARANTPATPIVAAFREILNSAETMTRRVQRTEAPVIGL